MPNLPSEKGQLNITGVKKTSIDLFRKLCEAEGRKQAKMFEMMVEAYKEIISSGDLEPQSPEIVTGRELPEQPERIQGRLPAKKDKRMGGGKTS
jgi:hypothetical protein